jgi:hypothetical protein
MKKLVLFLIAVFISISMYSQTNPKFVYSEIIGTARFMSTKVTIEISFGQRVRALADNRLKDPQTGKPIVFNSMIDALNFMGKQGWEFAQAYIVTESNQNIYHYLLKKPFTELSPDEQKEATEN